MSDTILVVRHTPENHLGTFASVLDELKLSYQYIEAYEAPYRKLEAFQKAQEDIRPKGLVVLGGPQHANDDELSAERDWLCQLAVQDTPMFAICLGAQMLSRVLGGEVYKNRHREVGWVPLTLTEEGFSDPVLQHLPPQTLQVQWHNDSFTLPPDAVPLASSEQCPQQAFRYKQNVLAVQFHPEASMDVVRQWLTESNRLSPQEKHALEQQSLQQLDLTQPDRAVHHSLNIFRAYCRQHFLPVASEEPQEALI